jgi:hypothetical protein
MLISCQPQKRFPEFDSAGWKQDRGGCKGKRTQLRPQLERIRKDLKGLSQIEVVSLLGKPDYQELANRGQKYFVYFLEKGNHCQQANAPTQSPSLLLRFNAVGLMSEITYETGRPVLPQ